VAQNFAVRREIRAMKTIFNVDYSAIPVDDFTQTIASQLTLVNADCECRFLILSNLSAILLDFYSGHQSYYENEIKYTNCC
jgi:hypothetical protein